MGDEENIIRETTVIKASDKSCRLSRFPPTAAPDCFSKVASNVHRECSYLVTTRLT